MDHAREQRSYVEEGKILHDLVPLTAIFLAFAKNIFILHGT